MEWFAAREDDEASAALLVQKEFVFVVALPPQRVCTAVRAARPRTPTHQDKRFDFVETLAIISRR